MIGRLLRTAIIPFWVRRKGVQIPSPAQFWRLDEASGSRLNTVTSLHFDQANGTPGNTAGKIGSAIALVGASNENLFRASDPSLNYVGDFSVFSWFKYTTIPANFGVIIQKGNVSVPNMQWGLNVIDQAGSKLVEFAISTTGGNAFNAVHSTPLSAGTWYFVVGVFTVADLTMKISLNGGPLQNAQVTSAIPKTGTGNLNLGVLPGLGNTNWDGAIDATGTVGSALTNAHCSALFNSGNGREFVGGQWTG